MFLNNLIPYEFNKVEPERELEEDKQYFITIFLPPSPQSVLKWVLRGQRNQDATVKLKSELISIKF